MDTRALSLLFTKAQPEIDQKLNQYKRRVSNSFWGKIKSNGQFPKNKGISFTTRAMLRVGARPLTWVGAKDTLCETNIGKTPMGQIMQQPSIAKRTVSLQSASLRSPIFDLGSFIVREMPEKELKHFEEGLSMVTKEAWDDKLRVEYHAACGNKMMSVLSANPTDTNPINTSDPSSIRYNAYIWETNAQSDPLIPAQISGTHIRVNINPNQLIRIGTFHPDILDTMASRLIPYDEDQPWYDETGIGLFDVMLPHERMGAQIARIENKDLSSLLNNTAGYEKAALGKTLGTKFVLRDSYSIRYDQQAPRFYPDDAFNTAMQAQGGYAYSANDPNTWPRFVRVYPYKEVMNNVDGGVSYEPNFDYSNAPFGLATIMTPRLMSYYDYPDVTGSYGSAKNEDKGNYAGNAVWYNPDRDWNEDRQYGYYKVKFGLAIEVDRPEIGNSLLCRLSHETRIQGNPATIPATPLYSEYNTFCVGTATGSEAGQSGLFGANTVLDTFTGARSYAAGGW